MLILLGLSLLALSPFPRLFFALGKTFQNLNVSSPAPVTIVSPDGDIDRYNTRLECPISVTTFDNVGYFHTMIWFWLYPCVDTTSLTFFDHIRLHTCDPVSTLASTELVVVLQNRIVRSAVPPPEHSNPLACGDQAIALTAAS